MKNHSDDPNRTPQERWQRFRRHLLVFVLVNAGLIALNFTRHPDKLWPLWPLMGWGIGLAFHAFKVVQNNRHQQITL